jgi:hypothetical protein
MFLRNESIILRQIVIVGIAIAATYAFFNLVPLRSQWTVFSLSGSEKAVADSVRRLQFNAVYLPLLLAFVLFILRRRPRLLRHPWSAAACGAVAGYFTGLTAYFCTSLFMPAGFSRLAQSLAADWAVFPIIPFLTFTWAFGLIVALGVHLIAFRWTTLGMASTVKEET